MFDERSDHRWRWSSAPGSGVHPRITFRAWRPPSFPRFFSQSLSRTQIHTAESESKGAGKAKQPPAIQGWGRLGSLGSVLWLVRGRAMTSSVPVIALALLAMLGVLVLFFHPVISSPFNTADQSASDLLDMGTASALLAAAGIQWLLALLQVAMRLGAARVWAGGCWHEPSVEVLRC